MPQVALSVPVNDESLTVTEEKIDSIDRKESDLSMSSAKDSSSTGTTNDNHALQFRAREIEVLVGDVLSERLGEVRYEPAKCKLLSQELAAHIMERIKEMAIKKYKMVAIVSIGSQKGVPGMQFGSRCLWNKETDQFASVKFTNGSLFAVAMVYGLCFE